MEVGTRTAVVTAAMLEGLLGTQEALRIYGSVDLRGV